MRNPAPRANLGWVFFPKQKELPNEKPKSGQVWEEWVNLRERFSIKKLLKKNYIEIRAITLRNRRRGSG